MTKTCVLYATTVMREVRFGSGAVALAVGDVVTMEISETGKTYWIRSVAGRLLYTFHENQNPEKYLALLVTKASRRKRD